MAEGDQERDKKRLTYISLLSLIRFLRCFCSLANQIAMDLPHIVHCGRPNQHHTHAGQAPLLWATFFAQNRVDRGQIE
jgi:hypothetical protein